MAWELFTATDRNSVLQSAPAEFFRAGFLRAPELAAQALSAALADDAIDANARQWFDIASSSFGGGYEQQSRQALHHARTRAELDKNSKLTAKIEWLEAWYGSADASTGAAATPEGAVSFAILDYKQPDEAYASKNLGDHVQTIASLGHLARRSGFRFTGDPDMVQIVENLQRRVRSDRHVTGDDALIDLHLVQRDATHHDLIPDGTWALAFGWYMHRQFGIGFDMPFNPRLRPIFVSFHVNAPAFLTPEVIDYLRRYAPVGCRDWNTVHLLLSAGVPAFFSGCITTTVDTVFPANPDTSSRSGTFYVDTPPTGPGRLWRQTDPAIRHRSFVDNVNDAIDMLTSYQITHAKIATSRLHCYLPARSLGADVEFRPKNPADVRFDGLVGISDDAYDRIRQGILSLLEPVLGAIGAGHSEDQVYTLWRELTAPLVEAAEAIRASVDELSTGFDIDAAVAQVINAEQTFERTTVGPNGPTVTIAAAVTKSTEQHLGVLIKSIVASSTRPIDAVVTCRGIEANRMADFASQFPTVSFRWFPTDAADFGNGFDTANPAQVDALDRVLLPELIGDVARVVQFALPAVCVTDIAELFDTELGQQAVAGRSIPASDESSGFGNAIVASKRTKNDPLAREIIVRTHIRHTFDFPAGHAGVLVLNIDRMRNDNFTREFAAWIERYKFSYQDVINTYAGPDRIELASGWNALPDREPVKDPRAVSWSGPTMPWDADYVQCRELWAEYAE